ncbi:MAG: hypothetical protein AB3N18_10400 [Allomuricauda sp.]
MLLAVVLPILLVIVIKDLDFNPTERPSNTSEIATNSIKQVEHDVMDMTIVKNTDAYVLQLNLKQPLKSASSVVYGLSGNEGENHAIGQIEGVGSYTFQLNGEIQGILIKDVIKNQEILKLEF